MGWIDSLRVLAALAVIMIHVCAPTVILNPFCGAWWVGHGLDTVSRFAVPLFLMISGALLLHKDEPIREYAKKRVLKIALPFLGWSLFYHFWAGSHDYHLWYFYLIIPLYLLIPVLRKVVSHLPTSYILYFAIIAGIITSGTSLLGWMEIQINIYANPFSAGVAYLLLGYAMAHRELKFKCLNLIGALSILIIFFGTYLVSRPGHTFNKMFYDEFGIFVMLQTVMIFDYVCKHKERFHQVGHSKAIRFIATHSFGVYLIHPFVLMVIQKFTLIPQSLFTVQYGYVGFIAQFLIVLGLSLLPVWIISKVPILRKFV